MKFLREVLENAPIVPDGGWNVGHLANLGIMLSCENFSVRFDLSNLNILFDIAESGDPGEVRDHDGRIVEVIPQDDTIVLMPRNDPDLPNGIVLDKDTLKEMGIEAYEQDDGADPDSQYDALDSNDTIGNDGSDFDDLGSEGIIAEGTRKAFRRVGNKIKRGFRVTSGFRKGRVVASAAAAYKPREKASTRMKLSIAAKKHKFIRVYRSKITKRRPVSVRLAKMNKQLPK